MGGQAGHDGHGEPASRPAAPQAPLDQLGHLLPQHPPPAGQPLLDGVLAQDERLGDLGHRLVLAVEQDQGLAIRLGDPLQRLPDEGLLLPRDRFLGGARLVAWTARSATSSALADSTGRDALRRAFFARFRAMPHSQALRRSGLLERRPLPPGRPEGLLGHVLAERQVAAGVVRHGADQRLVPPDQDLERRRAPPADELPESESDSDASSVPRRSRHHVPGPYLGDLLGRCQPASPLPMSGAKSGRR